MSDKRILFLIGERNPIIAFCGKNSTRRERVQSSIRGKGQGRRDRGCAFHEEREFLLSAIVY